MRASWNVHLMCSLSVTQATLNVVLYKTLVEYSYLGCIRGIAVVLEGDCRGSAKWVFTTMLRVWYCHSHEAETESEAHRGCEAFPSAHCKEWMGVGCVSLTAKLPLSSTFSSLPSSGNLCQIQSHHDMQEFYLLNVSSQTQHLPHWVPCLGCSVCCGGILCSCA